MANKRAQIAMEYLVLTAFIMVGVAIIFSFSFVNYSQNIGVAKTTEALSKLANAVDDVYTRGEGNTRFVTLSFPDGMKGISIVHKCLNGTQVSSAEDCGESANAYDDVKFSAIAMEVQFLSGNAVALEGTKAKIFENMGEMAAQNPDNPELNKYSGSTYKVKISWTETGLIKIEKA